MEIITIRIQTEGELYSISVNLHVKGTQYAWCAACIYSEMGKWLCVMKKKVISQKDMHCTWFHFCKRDKNLILSPTAQNDPCCSSQNSWISRGINSLEFANESRMS
jgi:hypothetical protein